MMTADFRMYFGREQLRLACLTDIVGEDIMLVTASPWYGLSRVTMLIDPRVLARHQQLPTTKRLRFGVLAHRESGARTFV